MGLSYRNLSLVVTSSDLLSHLQDLELDGGEKVVSFQWLGPHFLAILEYATKLYDRRDSGYYDVDPEIGSIPQSNNRFWEPLELLDDSACACILHGETEDYKNFLEIILSFMPELKNFFTMQNSLYLLQFSSEDLPWDVERIFVGSYASVIWADSIEFLIETIGILLSCQRLSNVLVSNQVSVLLKELKFLSTFILDTFECVGDGEQNLHILQDIDDVFMEVRLFLQSFFFTTDTVTARKMDRAVFVLLRRIEIVKVKIKDRWVAFSTNLGIGSLQVEESPIEVSSSQDKSIPIVEETPVGLEEMTTRIASKLLGGPEYRQIISIAGMPGLGKTTLAKKIYVLSNVRHYFDKLSWCVVSQTYNKRKLLIDILSSLSDLNRDYISEIEDEGKLAERLYKSLKGRRYLIVMDDLWDTNAWDDLKSLFPEDRNGSRILFTGRLKNVALEISHVIIEPPLLSTDESWDLLKKNVFKKERCPQELQDIGMQIAKNCHGLPLSVVTIAGVLSNMEKQASSWQRVAKELSAFISQKADDYIPSLELSFWHLPKHLKPCFLYLSAFQEDEEIPVGKLLLLWIAEDFIERREQKSLEDVAEEYLTDLINRSLLQVAKRRSDNGVKACTLHDLILDMCRKIAVEDEGFLFQHQFLISKNRHRLCMDRSLHLTNALSTLYNPEKVRIFYSDSVPGSSVVTELGIKIMPDLRCLNISSLKSSISRLQNLEFLVVRHCYAEIPAYLPCMPKLRHLCIGRGSHPARFSTECDNSRINSLQTLFYVDLEDEEILRCSPNLRELKCTSPDNRCPDLNFLPRLESLTMTWRGIFKGDYSVVNFPRNIKKLTLSKFGLPWEKMSLIGTLPNLEILKLQETFEGEIWDTKDDEFQKLKFLQLYRLELKQWNSSHNHFPVLERLVLRDCIDLEEIPFEFSYISTIQEIKVLYCGKKVETSAWEIRREQLDYGNTMFDVTIQSI